MDDRGRWTASRRQTGAAALRTRTAFAQIIKLESINKFIKLLMNNSVSPNWPEDAVVAAAVVLPVVDGRWSADAMATNPYKMANCGPFRDRVAAYSPLG
ncbi:hypothetical protein GWI33_015695 [Rhynchophorus ferrugineus]|uniref:Uncharacterized protein n=1 Tax=Rhynchophorus ferrugineus TaxID=354439 RepID=A0A834M5R4_RHYFE|nr:hypothetical protein GWI33_015695 [Rhynchophorus ferrugineus]